MKPLKITSANILAIGSILGVQRGLMGFEPMLIYKRRVFNEFFKEVNKNGS